MSFRSYLESNYVSACEIQEGIEHDAPMIEMLRNVKLQNSLQERESVQVWMTNYGLFQGIHTAKRKEVSASVLEFAARHQRLDREPDEAEIRALYASLFRVLHKSVPRSWASATSKLLWCLYPETVVIYDSFVHRALVVLQCVDESLKDFRPIGTAPAAKSAADIEAVVEYYMNYQAMVRRLFGEHGHRLRELKEQHGQRYAYDIRLLDKILWMLGNPNYTFPDASTAGEN